MILFMNYEVEVALTIEKIMESLQGNLDICGERNP